jgi:DNA-binding response OmpR family regulator
MNKILLVEDEPVVIELLKIYLEKHGFSIIHVSDGTDALNKVRGENPALIILDVMIPKLNGFEVCRLMKSDPVLKNIPIIILSALVQKKEIETGIRMGADLYMTKPFDNSELLSNIQKLLSKTL